MPARSKARKRALDILFEAEQRGLPVLELLAERMSVGEQPVPDYAAELVRGVASHREPLLVPDAYKDDRFLREVDGVTGFKTKTVLGLPLLNNYYTVFDRSLSTNGTIRFAPIRRPQET